MVSIADIRDKDSLKAWLDALPEEARYRYAVTIAARAALRVQPLLWEYVKPARPNAEMTVLVFLQSPLVSSVASTCPTGDIKERAASVRAFVSDDASALAVDASAATAFAATRAATRAASHAASHAASARATAFAAFARATASLDATANSTFAEVAAAIVSGDVTADATSADAAAAVAAAARAAASTRAAYAYAYQLVRTDCEHLSDGQLVWATPLIGDELPLLQEPWSDIAASWRAAGQPWAFFADWYEGLLRGEEPDWSLLEQIALLPDDEWEGEDAPKKIAGHIERILEKRRLQELAKALAEELRQLLIAKDTAPISQRFHNHPPELIEQDVSAQMHTLLGKLREVDEELAQAEPSASRLQELSQWILSFLANCGKYLGQKADLTIDTAIKWGIPAGGAWLIANTGNLKDLAQGVLDLASKMP